MDIKSIISTRNDLLSKGGAALLNIKYPKEFELYLIGLELCDEQFNTLQYFTFPINPSNIEESKPQLTNIKKTLAGVSVLRTPTFVPTDITLSGTFGRSFKILLGTNYEDFLHSFSYKHGYDDTDSAGKYSTNKSSITKGLAQTFNNTIKTGYGCIKILEGIVASSNSLDLNGHTRRLIFHNPALGNSYLVSAGTLRLFQSEQSNMIWNYSLQLKSIAPVESIFTSQQQKSAAKQLAVGGTIQRGVNNILNTTAKILGL